MFQRYSLALDLRKDIYDAPAVLGITQLERKHKTNLQPAATRHRGGHRLFLNLFLLFPFPFDCFWIFNTPICCLKKRVEYDQALTDNNLITNLLITCLYYIQEVLNTCIIILPQPFQKSTRHVQSQLAKGHSPAK